MYKYNTEIWFHMLEALKGHNNMQYGIYMFEIGDCLLFTIAISKCAKQKTMGFKVWTLFSLHLYFAVRLYAKAVAMFYLNSKPLINTISSIDLSAVTLLTLPQ